jgi:hypothetical protein
MESWQDRWFRWRPRIAFDLGLAPMPGRYVRRQMSEDGGRSLPTLRRNYLLRLRRPTPGKFAAGAIAVVVAALLLARPAALGLFMMIFIMAGLPALYRLRRYAHAPLDSGRDRVPSANFDVRSGVRDGSDDDGRWPAALRRAEGEEM